MDERTQARLQKVIRQNILREIRGHVDDIRRLLMGSMYGFGLDSGDRHAVGGALDEIEDAAKNGEYELVDREAFERYIADIRHLSNRQAQHEALRDPVHSEAWWDFKLRLKRPPRDGTKALARLQREVDELYRADDPGQSAGA